MYESKQHNMSLPAFAEVPSPQAQVRLPPEEWQACIDSWIVLAELQLRLPDDDWQKSVGNGERHLVGFLRSYFLAVSRPALYPQLCSNKEASQLRRLCFLLSHRALSTNPVPDGLLDWQYLISICSVFPRSEELKKLLSSAWKRRADIVDSHIQREKKTQIKLLDEGKLDDMGLVMQHAIPLLHQMPDIAAFLLTGSDLLDSIDGACRRSEASFRKVATIYVYLGLLGLLTCSQPSVSALSDHLYSLKSSSKVDQPSLVADIATNTPLIQRIRHVVGAQDAARATKLEKLLGEYRQLANARPKRLVRRKINKGKGPVGDDFDHGTTGGVHVHRMSLITQVQDLFPELGSGFIVKLLDEYNDNVEQVTAHLLDDSLPAHLSGLDRSMQLSTTFAEEPSGLASHLAPRSTPPPERRNVYDNDELDRLSVDASRLHFGRVNKNITADSVLADRSTAPNKAAILAALAAFDSDDDERDDTYDVEDVGGTVDTTMDNDEANADKNEEAMFAAYRMSAGVFNRDAATRRGKPRMALKSETGMTDEAIEGWAVMLVRDPRKLKRLEAKYASFTGQQNMLERTAWREVETGDAESSGGEAFSGRGRGRGYGRGPRGNRGDRGGGVSGPSNDAGTQQARNRKEANKGSRANHNRRDQRARKLARGGFAG
jgi:activating signal cointegrator complex subunit 2